MADDTTQPNAATGGDPGATSAETANTQGTGTPEARPNGEQEETLSLTQSALDKIVKERLDRQRAQFEAAQKKQKDDAEQQRLKEQGEYKALYDGLKADYDKLVADLAIRDRRELQRSVAKANDLPDDMAERLIGETEEELVEDAKRVAKLLAPAQPPNLRIPNGLTPGGSGKPSAEELYQQKKASGDYAV